MKLSFLAPCGEFGTECKVQGNSAVCMCQRGYKGHPISRQGCKPDCTRNEDCPWTKACINQQCVDPCACKLEEEREWIITNGKV
jgi:hypothetical protein